MDGLPSLVAQAFLGRLSSVICLQLQGKKNGIFLIHLIFISKDIFVNILLIIFSVPFFRVQEENEPPCPRLCPPSKQQLNWIHHQASLSCQKHKQWLFRLPTPFQQSALCSSARRSLGLAATLCVLDTHTNIENEGSSPEMVNLEAAG